MSYLETAVEIAREAGALLANYFERRIGFEMKGEFDLVTEADRASESLVVERLRAHFPAHGIVAEEGGGHRAPPEYCWYVDPLDGTTNFAHGFPMFNVTLGLERAGETIAGVVFDPDAAGDFLAPSAAPARISTAGASTFPSAQTLDDSLPPPAFPAASAATT